MSQEGAKENPWKLKNPALSSDFKNMGYRLWTF